MSLESDITRVQTQMEQVIPSLEKLDEKLEKLTERIRKLERETDKTTGAMRFLRLLLPVLLGAGGIKGVEELLHFFGGG